ncbi:MAG: PEP/pyruvate-binding domain-containing protein [Burkholderiaceae bacterium]
MHADEALAPDPHDRRAQAGAVIARAPARFGSKAQTLAGLGPLLRDSFVPQSFAFEVGRWRASPESVLAEVQREFVDGELAVRSSSMQEDGAAASMAGVFDSVLGVRVSDPGGLRAAIAHVVESMGDAAENQVLVQRMVAQVVMAGVVMTRELSTGAPYYVVNFDDESGRTDAVTGGKVTNKTVYVLRGHASRVRSPRLMAVLRAVREIEACFDHSALDIEFALDAAGRVATLQVRRMVASDGWQQVEPARIAAAVESLRLDVTERLSAKDPVLVGRKVVLGLMPDWNPAELLGLTPRPLAMSVFRALISRDSWRLARAGMGYRDPTDRELLHDVLGHPYIDVRASFNSLLPAALDDDTAGRLVDAWVTRLIAHPELHDKVEFEVVQSCMDFTFDAGFAVRADGRLDAEARERFAAALRALTRDALRADDTGSLALAVARLRSHEAVQLARGLPVTEGVDAASAIATADDLFARARTQAAIPFAVCARHAFIGEALLRSAVSRGRCRRRGWSTFTVLCKPWPRPGTDRSRRRSMAMTRPGFWRALVIFAPAPSRSARPDMSIAGASFARVGRSRRARRRPAFA